MLARKKYNISRILYVDIDTHQGDGVYYEFENDPHTYIADIHEDGYYLYPGTGSELEIGTENAKGTKLNIPLEPHSGNQDFITAFNKNEEFIKNISNLELIILQCGTDGIKGDPLTHLQYSSKAHAYAANKLHQISHELCNGKIITLGGGGYNQTNIAEWGIEVVKSFVDDV